VDSAAAIDDPIFYLPGGKLPVVMTSPHNGYSKLKGDCYVHIPIPGLEIDIERKERAFYTLELDREFGPRCEQEGENVNII
jgi:hypothetical protein